MRWQQIKNSTKGSFVLFKKRRHYLDEFLRIDNGGVIYHKTTKKGIVPCFIAHGYKSWSNAASLMIEVSKCGESARLALK